MEKFESVGKNVEKAIENGLKELNVTRDQVDIEVLDAGGIFKKARVLLTVVEDDSDIKSIMREESASTIMEEEKEEQQEIVPDEEVLEEVEQEEQENVVEANDVALDDNAKQEDTTGLSVGAKTIKEFLDGYLKLVKIEASVEINEDADVVKVDIVGRDSSKLIGKHGDGLNAIQYLCNIIAGKVDRECGKIYIDTCGYKEQREQELIKLARKLKFTALREEREVKLEPMSAYDRKIIHKALHEDDSVETHSEGEEPKRYVVITLKTNTENNVEMNNDIDTDVEANNDIEVNTNADNEAFVDIDNEIDAETNTETENEG